MFLELRLLLVLFGFSAFVFLVSLLPTSLFISVDEDRSKVYTNGQVVFYREPLWHNLHLNYVEEVVTPDGQTCSALPSSASYESYSGAIMYHLKDSLMPCVMEGSTYRVTREYLFFQPYTTEMTVENMG